MELTRRRVLGLAALCAGLAVLPRPPARAASPGPDRSADEILKELVAGNQRFMKGTATSPRRAPGDFLPLAQGQRPEAVIVSCADSRVPPELVFDQGVGDLFVVRVAGNVVAKAGPPVKGSIEYGVAELGVSLVMVLGHTECGAVKAAIKHLDDKDALPGALGRLVNSIKPAVARAKGMPGDFLDNALRANVAIGVEQLRGLQPIVAPAVQSGRIKVVGAMYDLRAGSVTLTA